MINFSTISIYKFITNYFVKKHHTNPCVNLGSGHGEVEKNFKVDLSIDLFDNYASNYNKFLEADLNLPLDMIEDSKYKLAMCFGTIHFLNNPKVAIEEVYRILANDGTFLLNITNSGITNLWAKVNKLPIKHYGLTENRLEKLLKETGFNIKKKHKLGIKTYYLCSIHGKNK